MSLFFFCRACDLDYEILELRKRCNNITTPYLFIAPKIFELQEYPPNTTSIRYAIYRRQNFHRRVTLFWEITLSISDKASSVISVFT